MDEAIPVDPGHVGVDLGHDDLRRIRGGLGHVDTDAQGAEAVLVRGRDMEQGHVQGPTAGAEEVGDLREEAGQVVHPGAADVGPHVVPHEEVCHPEAAGVFGQGVVHLAHHVDVDQLHVPQALSLGHQGIHQDRGGGGPAVDEDAVAGLDTSQGFGCGGVAGH